MGKIILCRRCLICNEKSTVYLKRIQRHRLDYSDGKATVMENMKSICMNGHIFLFLRL